MRALFAVLALLGLGGVVLGVFTMIHGAQNEPFKFENYGGPGPIIAGLLLIAVSIYLFSVWPRIDSTSRRADHR